MHNTEKLILSKGYNGFSYSDIADEIGIRKASIHYHFPTKSELGSAFVKKYLRLFRFWCRVKAPLDSQQKIMAFGAMYKDLSGNCSQICPVAMLSAEYPTLPANIQKEIRQLIKEVEDWLFNVLEKGKKEKVFRTDIDSKIIVKIIYCSLSNAISMYRIFNNLDEIDQMIVQILKMICL